MTVNFYAVLRQIVGSKSIELPLPEGATVQQLIEAVISQYPRMRSILLDEKGQLHGHVHVFINGRDAPYLESALETALTPNDTVDIFPATAGGSLTNGSPLL